MVSLWEQLTVLLIWGLFYKREYIASTTSKKKKYDWGGLISWNGEEEVHLLLFLVKFTGFHTPFWTFMFTVIEKYYTPALTIGNCYFQSDSENFLLAMNGDEERHLWLLKVLRDFRVWHSNFMIFQKHLFPGRVCSELGCQCQICQRRGSLSFRHPWTVSHCWIMCESISYSSVVSILVSQPGNEK